MVGGSRKVGSGIWTVSVRGVFFLTISSCSHCWEIWRGDEMSRLTVGRRTKDVPSDGMRAVLCTPTKNPWTNISRLTIGIAQTTIEESDEEDEEDEE